MNEKVREDWDNYSDAYYARIMTPRVLTALRNNPFWAFPPEVRAMLPAAVGDVRDKRVCVPASGDNIAVFGFHLLGARVTSMDLSSRQIANARRVAQDMGWDIDFLVQDSMDFSDVPDEEYDLVYTSNGAHVWISDLPRMYRNFHRALRPGGSYLFFETHPFIRPFDDSQPTITIRKLYEDLGPFGDVPNYAWRVQDFFNSLIGAGFTLRHMEEFHANPGSNDLWWYKTFEEAEADGNSKFDWKQNPWAALPQWFAMHGQRDQ